MDRLMCVVMCVSDFVVTYIHANLLFQLADLIIAVGLARNWSFESRRKSVN